MKVAFRQSFARDLKKIKDKRVVEQLKQAIAQVEAANNLHELGGLTKLGGTGGYYRIRVGDYRIGIVLEVGEVEFVRCLHRRDIYRYFPIRIRR
ncbi:MAG: type II toxin-antitoxin system RelE family toxin [Gammaproteobacteria bacterium]